MAVQPSESSKYCRKNDLFCLHELLHNLEVMVVVSTQNQRVQKTGVDKRTKRESTKLRTKPPEDLVELALKALPRMMVPESNVFCGELHKNNLTPTYDRERSPRYTIISLLG